MVHQTFSVRKKKKSPMFFSLSYRIWLDPWTVEITMIYKQTVEPEKQKNAENLSGNNCSKKARRHQVSAFGTSTLALGKGTKLEWVYCRFLFRCSEQEKKTNQEKK